METPIHTFISPLKLKSIKVYFRNMPKLEFYGQVQETDGIFVILIPSNLSGIAKGLKGKQLRISVDL